MHLAPDRQAAEMQSWRTLASIPAVRNNRLHFLPGRSYVVPGPRVAEGAETMAQLLHGIPAGVAADRRSGQVPKPDHEVRRELRAEGRE